MCEVYVLQCPVFSFNPTRFWVTSIAASCANIAYYEPLQFPVTPMMLPKLYLMKYLRMQACPVWSSYLLARHFLTSVFICGAEITFFFSKKTCVYIWHHYLLTSMAHSHRSGRAASRTRPPFPQKTDPRPHWPFLANDGWAPLCCSFSSVWLTFLCFSWP